MPRTPAKAKADAKWEKKAYDKLLIRLRKDSDLTADVIREHAASQGESTNGFIKRAVVETMQRDNESVG